MEHRLNHRIPTTVELEVYRHGRHLGRYTAINFSVTGLLLVDTPASLVKHDVLQLHLCIDERDPPTSVLSGLVIHTGRHGTGVMFGLEQRDPFAVALNRILYMSRQPGASDARVHEGRSLQQ